MFATESSVRWRVSDEFNGPTKAQAKAMGLTLKRYGRTRRYYDQAGILRMAYSYNTCILAHTGPTDDHPQGRYVINLTRYSMTSNRHLTDVLCEIGGKGWYGWWRFSERTPASMALRTAIDCHYVDEDTTDKELLSAATMSETYERIAKDAARRKAAKLERKAV